jgi:hypothetical protein
MSIIIMNNNINVIMYVGNNINNNSNNGVMKIIMKIR